MQKRKDAKDLSAPLRNGHFPRAGETPARKCPPLREVITYAVAIAICRQDSAQRRHISAQAFI